MDPDVFMINTTKKSVKKEVASLTKQFVRFKLGPHTMATQKFVLQPDHNAELLAQMQEDFGGCSDLEEEDDYETDQEICEKNSKYALGELKEAIDYWNDANKDQRKALVKNFIDM